MKYLSVFVLLFLFTVSGCVDELVDPIQLQVSSTGGSFSGYYTKDGEDAVHFDGGLLVGGYASYKKELKFYENIFVSVNPASTSVNEISIQVYRDGLLVKEVSEFNPAELGTSVSLSYVYNEENNETDDTTE